jgi:hypothetical protein
VGFEDRLTSGEGKDLDAEKAGEGAGKGNSGGCGSMGCRGCSRDGVLVESEGEG